eukprot:1821822-Karenia_brevis.AAC.1
MQWVVSGLLSLPWSNDRPLPSTRSVLNQWQTASLLCLACVDCSPLAALPLLVFSCVDFGCSMRRGCEERVDFARGFKA